MNEETRSTIIKYLGWIIAALLVAYQFIAGQPYQIEIKVPDPIPVYQQAEPGICHPHPCNCPCKCDDCICNKV